MKLPNSHLAIVEREKVVHYLMNASHPDNGGKAVFFAALGFSADGWELSNSFLDLADKSDVWVSIESSHGMKNVVDGALITPSGKCSTVRTIWIVEKGSENPRLVTAYPREEGKND